MLLVNISTTVDIVGLSTGACCTHSKPTWITRKTSDKSQVLFKDSSINSNDFCSL
ncbi:hypothetical protein OIU79_026493 [Salix purpurea]|uniref:Uncharacterized protein n=1 Tax=Salix purpurea TaxID=77065 RepID=A0A9Q0VS44_SALPP|nr:hypothetical protein OIU79_026493 [Salix purpurea]